MTKIVKSPKDCTAQELAAFEAMVRKGEEVIDAGLTELISRAAALLFMYDTNESLVGIAALKHPRPTYRRKVFKRAQSNLNPEDYRFELGWIFVDESYRGEGLSGVLVGDLMAHMATGKVYATSRESNIPMRRTLERFGFTREGYAYAAKDGDYRLGLYVRA